MRARVRCPVCGARDTEQADGVIECQECGHVWDAPDEEIEWERRLRWRRERI